MITVGDGANVVLGGAAADTIDSGMHDDVILGDNGSAMFTTSATTRLLAQIATSDPSNSGNDMITAGDGANVVFGGSSDDTITTGSGPDVLVGDNGSASFQTSGVMRACSRW